MDTSRKATRSSLRLACAGAGSPTEFEVGGFLFHFDDQIGEVNFTYVLLQPKKSATPEVHRIRSRTGKDIMSLINGGAPSPYGNLTRLWNVTLLDAEFTSGPNSGKTAGVRSQLTRSHMAASIANKNYF